jgi:hypothetical protein
MKKIIIESKTHGRHEVLLDDEDYEWVSKHRWQVNPQNNPNYKGPDKFYVVRSTSIKGKKKNFSLHREIVKAPKGMQVDHTNGNPLDNRRSNLRLCTPRQNSANRVKASNNTTGFIGVTYRADQPQRPYCAQHFDKKLGGGFSKYFRTAEEAAVYRDKQMIDKYGEFAGLNFPDGVPNEVRRIINESKKKPVVRRRNNSSGYRGVSFETKTTRWKKPWRVSIFYQKKSLYIGNFATKEEGARARDKKAVELFGEFPQLNFPEEWMNVSGVMRYIGKGISGHEK